MRVEQETENIYGKAGYKLIVTDLRQYIKGTFWCQEMTDLNFSFVIESKINWKRGLELGDWLEGDHNKSS